MDDLGFISSLKKIFLCTTAAVRICCEANFAIYQMDTILKWSERET
jgi:hypothetical protein